MTSEGYCENCDMGNEHVRCSCLDQPWEGNKETIQELGKAALILEGLIMVLANLEAKLYQGETKGGVTWGVAESALIKARSSLSEIQREIRILA